MLYRVLLFVLLLAASFASAADVYLGMPVDELEAKVGEPTSRSSLGEREILHYPDGVIIRTYKGKIVSVKGMDYDLKAPEQPQQKKSFSLPSPPEVEVAPEPTPTVQQEADRKPEPATVQTDKTEELMEKITPAGQLEQLKQTANKNNEFQEFSEEPAEEEDASFSGIVLFFFANFFVGAVILKIAFTIYGFPLLTRNLIILTAAYGLLMVSTGFIFSAVPFLGMIPYLDILLTLILLWICIHHFSDVRQGITSLQIAFIAWFPGAAINMFLL